MKSSILNFKPHYKLDSSRGHKRDMWEEEEGTKSRRKPLNELFSLLALLSRNSILFSAKRTIYLMRFLPAFNGLNQFPRGSNLKRTHIYPVQTMHHSFVSFNTDYCYGRHLVLKIRFCQIVVEVA